VQELYRFAGYSSMALHTAASLLVLAGALLWAPVDGVATALRKPGPAAELARWLLPGAVLVPAFLGWLVGLGLRRGLYAEGMDLAVLALAMMLSLAGLVVWTANAVHRTDSARRETEAQLENQAALMDQAHDALIVREMGGAVLFWNRGAEALYGWTATEAVGQRPHALLRTDPDAVRQFDAALEHGRHWFGELIHTTRDGRRVTVEARQTAARAADGRLLVLESVRDVTERKRAEEQLAAEKDRLAVTLRSIGDAVIATDESGHVTLLNKVAEDLTGWRAEDAIGQPLSRVFHIVNEETRREVESPVQRVLREGVVVGLANHTALIAKDGTDRPIADSGAPVRDLQGRIIGVVLVFRDQTEERRAEETLERSREGLSRLADASSRVVRETDLHGMLQAVSEAALLLTDARIATCGHGDVVGRSMVGGSARVTGAPACPPGEMFVLERGGVHMDLVEGADSIRLTDAQLRAHPRLRGGPPDHVPMRGLLGVRMSRRDGRTNGLILVTDKAHGEFTDEDESLLRQLATIASLALQHVEARISLEASNRSKNEFLAVLSHELRNPLAPIRNSLYILDRAAPGSEQAGRAQAVIDRQVVHLTRLVDDLLDVTRISRGKIQLRRERLDLCDLLRRTIEDHRSEFARNGLHLHSTLPEKPLWIDADRIRISQVIGNLLHNSAKFTDAGGHVSVSIRANENLGHAVVQVRDTGVGIGPDVLHRVFEPFAQADTSLARSKGGLGLGLALVKGLVEMHGGTVTVEREGLGKGAEFLVRLPLDSTPVPEAAQPRRAVDVRPRRVLVIEDNVDAANSLREVLELSSHVLAVAYSGSEAIEKARAFRPEVVLCDIGLPGMDGYQVARTMRADPELRGAKLVALTGYAAPEDVAKSRDAGFDAHIAKPPKVEALQAVLASERSS
jgi:PAS domain S-box-containing protein